jgi:hypothetical protein
VQREAIEALVAVSQEALLQVQRAKRQLIQSLETRQDDLLEMRFAEKSISPALFKRKQDKLQTELDAALESLAESEHRLKLDGDNLRMALELAGDVALVYATGAEPTKRGYNQAFFTKLYVRAEWDMDAGQTDVWITRATLTPIYAALLAEDFAESVQAEVKAIRAQGTKRAPESRSDSPKPCSVGVISYYEHMAERAGFEPAMERDAHTRLAGECLQPLGHLSLGSGCQCRAWTQAELRGALIFLDPSRRRSPSLQIALHRSLVADGRRIGVLAELPASPALAQEIPAAVELYLDRRQALMMLGRSMRLVDPQQRVLLGDQLLDLVQDAFVIHGCSLVLRSRTA